MLDVTADFPKRKVFISWSKAPTDEVASAFAELLKHMFDNVQPWVSRDDIELGSLSIAEIHKELAETTFGVLLVTRRNQSEPWLNFEAGSLAKTVVDGAGTRVVPLLIDMESAGQLEPGPLANLQAEPATREGVKKLMNLVGVTVGADREAIDARWGSAWAGFEAVLEAAREELAKGEPEPQPRKPEDMLEEILELTRRAARRPSGVRSAPRPAQLGVGINASLTPDSAFPIIRDALAMAKVNIKEATWQQQPNGEWMVNVVPDAPFSKPVLSKVYKYLRTMTWPGPLTITIANSDGSEEFEVRVGQDA